MRLKPSTTKPRSLLFLGALLLLTLPAALLFAGSEMEEESFRGSADTDAVLVIYQGLLQDKDGDPVSGVFPFQFHLYRSGMSALPLWSETHYVSVIDGTYQVPLGSTEPLAHRLLSGQRWIGVELLGEGEILRDQILIRPPESSQSGRALAQALSHADSSDFALEAQRARVADNALALDGMTAQEIENLANLALQRLGEHIADPHAHSATARYRIGSDRRTMDSVGGRGGSPYDVRCPPGHVVTGIEGGAGRLVDSLSIICSPLE